MRIRIAINIRFYNDKELKVIKVKHFFNMVFLWKIYENGDVHVMSNECIQSKMTDYLNI